MSETPASKDSNSLDERHAAERLAELYPSDARSPLHPKALRMKDMRPGRKILYFDIRYGIAGEHTVVVEPHPYRNDKLASVLEGSLIVTTTCTNGDMDGKTFDRFCTDMGLQPYGGGSWNRSNFTIDANDRHLLPEPDPELRYDEFGAEEYFRARQAARSMNRRLLL